MSLILDALNRSERERREAEGMPGLHSVHAAVPEQGGAPRKRPRLERWLLLLVVAILAVDVLPGRWQDRAREPDAAAGLQRTAGTGPPVDAGNGPGATPLVGAAKPALVAAVRPAPAPADSGNPEVQALYRREMRAPRPPVSAPSQPRPPTDEAAIEALLAQVKAGGQDPVNPYFAVPYITDLPADVRSRVPTLNYTEHHLGGTTSEHRVRINGILLAPGQSLRSDLVLEGIYPEGIVLKFQGESFRLEALNRWVNF